MIIKDILNYNRIIKMLIDNEPNINSLIKFRLLGMLKQFEPAVENYEKIRDELISKYGKSDDDGRFGIFPPIKDNYDSDEKFEEAKKEFEDTIQKFNEEITKIGESESEINIVKFKADDIMNAGIPADYLVVLYDLIEE